jgi:membrane protein required for colicin V production
MSGLDYFIILVLVASALLSLIRGFIREALSLLVWVAAGAVALSFAPRVAPALANLVGIDALRTPAAFAIVFIIVLVLGSIVSFVIGHALHRGGLSGTDRLLGLLFGFARGVVIVSVLLLLGGLTPLVAESWWQQSVLVGHFEPVTKWLRGLLPAELDTPV